MLNKFEPRHLKKANAVLLSDLQMAEQVLKREKAHQIELAKKPSLWGQVKGFVNRYL